MVAASRKSRAPRRRAERSASTESKTQRGQAPRDPRDCGRPRPSRRARFRALSLILVHVAVLAHVLHWWISGRTLTPVEPSEAMQTLGQGLVNAGFVLFAVLILGTAVFGRFFCGWACHIVALQDLCTFLLRRAGVRPRPFRSRLLAWVPLGAAIYMFVVPSLVRWWYGGTAPAWTRHFVTDDFWGRFPGWPVALLTFGVCGFLIVYLLGNKGFCTYGCPYGGVFALADRMAPGRIRVTDACEGCGHCTATCTSNVRVHEEVRLWGGVVDPGCMKCMDCVNVCPKGALYYGLGAPVLTLRPGQSRRRPRHDFTWGEELALACSFVVTLLCLVGLYGAIPLLLALGLSAISAYALLTGWRSLRAERLGFARWTLRSGGASTTAGRVFQALMLVWVLFLVQSAWVKTLHAAGARRLTRAMSGVDPASPELTAEARTAFEQALALLSRADRASLIGWPDLLARLGSASSHLGRHAQAERFYRRAVAGRSGMASARYELARYAEARGDKPAAISHLEAAVREDPELPGALDGLTDLLLEADRVEEAESLLASLIRRRPHASDIRLDHAVVLAQAGDVAAGLEEIAKVLDEFPGMGRAHYERARLLAKAGRFEAALVACEEALDQLAVPDGTRWFCSRLAARLERWDTARRHLEAARARSPYNPRLARAWAAALERIGELEARIAEARTRAEKERLARFELIWLYRAAGRADAATELMPEFAASEPGG